MKSNTSKQLMNELSINLLFRKFANLMKERIILLLVFMYGGTISAQGTSPSNDIQQIVEINSFISSLNTPSLTSRISYSESQNVEDLLYKIQSEIYFNSGVANSYGEKPRSFLTDISSLNSISNSNLLINNIEIVSIKINDAKKYNQLMAI